MAARGAALNPTSLPFFPVGPGHSQEDHRIEGNRGSVESSLAGVDYLRSSGHNREHTSTTDYQSFSSSPSPPNIPRTESPESSMSPSGADAFSPSQRVDGGRYPSSVTPETNARNPVNGIEGKALESHVHTPDGSGYASQLDNRKQVITPSIPPGTQPISILRPISRPSQQEFPSSTHAYVALRSTSNFMIASSPASSTGESRASTNVEYIQGLEAQLKASPFINEILDRLVRCELSGREIRHELGEIHRKVELLLQTQSPLDQSHRTLDRSLQNSEPTFRNPFAPSAGTLPPANGSGFSGGNNISTTPPVRSQDEIAQISQRLNTLTTSVSQLLALQTQQHMQTVNSGYHPSQGPSGNPGGLNDSVGHNNGAPLSGPMALSNRPDLRPPQRAPNPPMRTWSAGSLDLPMRPTQDPNGIGLGRPDSFLRGKRGSVASLMRRDSGSLASIPDTNGEWSGSPRDSGPVVSKWEHLPLAPDLLRSIAKFGVGPPNKIQQRALPFLLRGADIIAQAPPTQERIAAYVIPAIHITLGHLGSRASARGPIVVMISTTVDQATQAQRMIRDLGGPIGVRSALGVGANVRPEDIAQELHLLHQNIPHILCGTPQKLHALFTAPHGLLASEVRFLVLDEVDQLIARNLHDYVFNIVKLLPPPRSRPLGSNGNGAPGTSPTPPIPASFGPFEQTNAPGGGGPSVSPFQPGGRRFSTVTSIIPEAGPNGNMIERQTALFSNTVPQDVLNLANAIQLREPVRVLVRRDGNVTHADTNNGARGLRQFYLYLAFTAGGRVDPAPATPGGGLGIIGSGRSVSVSSAETAQAREWKLEALADLFDDIDVPQAIVHVGGMTALDTVVYKLASRGLEAVPLHGDMNAGTKLAALNKFRNTNSIMMRQQPTTKVLVVYDVQVKAPDVFQVPLVINYDLPKAVEEYAHRVAPAISSSYSRAGVVINFVTATGGDVEMLRSIECFYKIKCPEVPMSLRDVL
ncbi:hypothetical protein M422DRAFT_22693 [Sphaerobolus stellatus SS14]|nr:hypothetical protein M422DRAFT_22693 [Sphaerobolus stellatus SS14]